MTWTDIAWIIIACTSANHLGLVSAVEQTLHRRLPIVNCTKCSTFWATLLCLAGCSVCCDSIAATAATIMADLPQILALSFLASYLAIWLELIMYIIDTLYNRIYDSIQKDNPEEGEAD